MRNRSLSIPQGVPTATLATAYARLRAELDVPQEFSAAALREAENTRAASPDIDLTDIGFFTIDPPSARDLDQALYLERRGSGYRVYYAIADIGQFITAGGALDAETWARGQTIYLPDGKIPLHPPVLSEGVASLLPGQDCVAYVWQLDIAADGELVHTGLQRAWVRSRRRMTYQEVQADIDAGTADDQLTLLRKVGELRIDQELIRGGASLRIPDQEVRHRAGDSYQLAFRPPVAAEDWNAQISLLTGMAAAQVMLTGKMGILRTLPEPDHNNVNEFKRQAKALGVDWPGGADYGSFLRLLDPADPKALALMFSSRRLFRGAGYTAFDGQIPDEQLQAAVGAPYAHTTAPIRRLVDRYVLLICESLLNGNEVCPSLRAALPKLPDVMQTSGRRANSADRRSIDIAEAAFVADSVGKTFVGVVVGERGNPDQVLVQGTSAPIVHWCSGRGDLGQEVSVRVDGVDLNVGIAHFSVT